MHPEVCGSSVKETHYLDDRVKPGAANFSRTGLDGYAQFFQPGPGEHLLVEATPSYADQHQPLEVLRSLPQPPRIVFVLREPAARILSQFRYMQHTLRNIDQRYQFSDWLASEAGARELAKSNYLPQLQRWSAALGRERIYALLFEDFIAAPQQQLSLLLDWAGLSAHQFNRASLTQRNRTHAVRFPALEAVAGRVKALLPRGLVARLMPVYSWLNTQAVQISASEQTALLRLRQDFRVENEQLASRFGLNISPWLNHS